LILRGNAIEDLRDLLKEGRRNLHFSINVKKVINGKKRLTEKQVQNG